jgi:hypothetical protein
MLTLLIGIGAVCAAILAIVGVVKLLRPVWRWVRSRAFGRAHVPRTKVILTDVRGFWGDAENEQLGRHVGVNATCYATNAGGPLDLAITEARLVGAGGRLIWSSFDSWTEDGLVVGARLKSHEATMMNLTAAVKREPPARGEPISVRLELIDQYGHRHRSAKAELEDGNPRTHPATTS